nr:TilS substrate-binding domain-containing protein [Flaviflexus huanghaiensis]
MRRVAVRERALPALSEALGIDVREPLARTASLIQDDLDYLDGVAGAALADARGENGLRLDALRPLHRAIRTRVLRAWLLEEGARPGELSGWHLAAVDRLIDGETGRGVDIPGLRATRTRDCLVRVVE